MNKEEFRAYLITCIENGNYILDGEDGEELYTFNRKTEIFLEKVGIDIIEDLLLIVAQNGWSRERKAQNISEQDCVEFKLELHEVPAEYKDMLDDRLYLKATITKVPTIAIHD